MNDNNKTSLILADEKDTLVDLGHQIKTLLPGGEQLSNNQAISVANYAGLTKANAYRGEIYGYVNHKKELQLVDGYKLLVRWAKNISEYTEKYSERFPVGVEGIEDGDIGYRISILRDDKKHTIREYIVLGATFQEAYDLVSVSAVGIVLKKETSKDPPKGWSWDQVARKRALKNVLNMAYAMPSIEKLAKDSWIVNGQETEPEDWPAPEVYTKTEEAERHAELAAQERERQEKVSAMDVEEKAVYDQNIVTATETMRSNGDDDPLGEAPPLNDDMDASTQFWVCANSQEMDRNFAGKFIRDADGDFDQALKALKAHQEG